MFTIPNEANAAFASQAAPDSGDIAILVAGYEGTGVVSGCAVTAQATPDMTLAVAAGTVAVAGKRAAVTAGNVTIAAAGATNPRIDLVVASSAGLLSVTAGAAAAAPVYPAIPASSVVLAAVYVPAGDTAIDANQITDKRVPTGGASAWEQVLSIAGTEAMTNWTAAAGTWAVNAAGYWEVTVGGRSVLRYDPSPRIHAAGIVFEAEVFNPSGGAGSTRLGIGQTDATDNVFQPSVFTGVAGGAAPNAGPTVPSSTTVFNDFGNSPGTALDTWTKLRGVFLGSKVTAYVDGVCRGSAYAGADFRGAHSVCLWTQDGKARFRNIKLWTLTGGLPA